ncbi:hypothetical protein D5F01_LYC10927 [Larimichthys crocea]|uniref:Uncharacterized protein n=1 Tax=Larimichthys crocea TaxID=215358 RepID=A0A6G0III9_LARCR|nr:uncharacterized protein C14orf119 homolog [Larimichthys crocea]KAE8291329.1 hypothetical protein D5F01_LYC10927 [Larimichthys crocea]
MSWFSHVSQGSNNQQPVHNHRLAATDSLCSALNSRLGGSAEGAPTMATQHWTGCSTPSPIVFPSAPHGVVSPPSLEKLSCSSLNVGQVRDPDPISYVSLQEQRCVLSWFQGWTAAQRERFLQDLLGKAVPGKVCTLLDSLNTLQVKDRLPNIFECQLRLWTQWFESWGEEERNHFLHMLEERDPVFVSHFYRSVAGTAGRD